MDFHNVLLFASSITLFGHRSNKLVTCVCLIIYTLVCLKISYQFLCYVGIDKVRPPSGQVILIIVCDVLRVMSMAISYYPFNF